MTAAKKHYRVKVAIVEHDDIIVEADTPEEAQVIGLAEIKKHNHDNEDNYFADFILESVEEVEL